MAKPLGKPRHGRRRGRRKHDRPHAVETAHARLLQAAPMRSIEAPARRPNAALLMRLYTALDRYDDREMAACYHRRPIRRWPAHRPPGGPAAYWPGGADRTWWSCVPAWQRTIGMASVARARRRERRI